MSELSERGVCATCRWWMRVNSAPAGMCDAVTDDKSKPAYVEECEGGIYLPLWTRPHFGCNQWQERE